MVDSMQVIKNALPVAAAATLTAVGIGTYFWVTSKNQDALPIDLENQSVLLDAEEGIRCSVYTKDGILMECMFEDARTLHEAFKRGLRISNDGPCLGTRPDGNSPFQWLTYSEVYKCAHAFGSALQNQLGLLPCADTFVGIFASNCVAWVVAEQACNMFSMVTVPLYDTLGSEACAYIINQTSMNTVLVDTEAKVLGLLDSFALTPCLRHLIVTETKISEETKLRAKACGVELLNYHQFLERGKEHLLPEQPPTPDSLATICYTSGTTGNPKGCMLSHSGIMSNISSSLGVVYKFNLPFGPDDAHISYLPLAHMFERGAQAFCFMNGMRVGFFRGDVRLLMDDIKELRPTMFCTVPRLLNRMYDKVLGGVAESRVKRLLLQWALRKKKEELRRGLIRKDGFLDRLVFHKIHESTGGRIKVVITGSAPLSDEVLSFVRAAFGCHVFEGYGQTECTAAVTVTVPGEYRGGLVGAPISCNLVKLIDVPEMNYWAKEGKGEVCVKGTNTFLGYYKEQERTAETLDSDGWVHTGDVGMWLENGALKIIDRKKHIFKLAQGEYIAPEKLEQIYMRSNFISQIFVDGDSLNICVVAIVVPNVEYVIPWARSMGYPDDLKSLCRDADGPLRKAVLNDLAVLGKAAGLKGFEQVRGIHLHPDMFSPENGLLTPTFKAKRPDLRRYFANEIAQIYRNLASD